MGFSFVFIIFFAKMGIYWRKTFDNRYNLNKWEKVGDNVMDLLLGTYEHTLDDKTRLIIPAKVRLKMGGLVYLSKGFDGCLELRSIEAFEK